MDVRVRVSHIWHDGPQVGLEVDQDGTWVPYGDSVAASAIDAWVESLGDPELVLDVRDWPVGEYRFCDGAMVPLDPEHVEVARVVAQLNDAYVSLADIGGATERDVCASAAVLVKRLHDKLRSMPDPDVVAEVADVLFMLAGGHRKMDHGRRQLEIWGVPDVFIDWMLVDRFTS